MVKNGEESDRKKEWRCFEGVFVFNFWGKWNWFLGLMRSTGFLVREKGRYGNPIDNEETECVHLLFLLHTTRREKEGRKKEIR